MQSELRDIRGKIVEYKRHLEDLLARLKKHLDTIDSYTPDVAREYRSVSDLIEEKQNEIKTSSMLIDRCISGLIECKSLLDNSKSDLEKTMLGYNNKKIETLEDISRQIVKKYYNPADLTEIEENVLYQKEEIEKAKKTSKKERSKGGKTKKNNKKIKI